MKENILLILEGNELSNVVIGNSLCPPQPTILDSNNVLMTEGPIFEAWHLSYTDWKRRDKATCWYILLGKWPSTVAGRPPIDY